MRSTGLAILSNARLLLLPLVLAPYVAWRVRPAGRAIAAAALVVVGAALVTAPWVVRNKVVIGCATITTDTRALWKANNPATYDVLARGGWIDDVPDLPDVPPWPEKAAGISVAAAKAVDECAQSSFYRDEVFDFWRDHPGEKARLAVQAVGMLWSPFLSVTADDAAQQGASDLAQRTVEPAFVLMLYAFALWGAFLAPRRFVALAALLLGFNTLMAMVFAGTVRYRAPWDFVLALLAAFALERAWELLLRKRRSPPRQRRLVERRDPLGAALLREPVERAGAASLRPSPLPAPGRPPSSAIARTRASTSPGGTSSPVRPSSTISGSPPTALAITGRPRSIASRATIPKPSPKEGTTTTSARSRTGSTGATRPRKVTASPSPSRMAVARSSCSSSPSPAISSVSPGSRSRARATARSSTS